MNEDQPTPNPWIRSLMVWGGIFLALLLVVSMFGGRDQAAGNPIAYSDFRAKVAEGTVADVQVSADQITGHFKNGDRFSTVPIPDDTTLPQLLSDNQVKYAGRPKEEPSLVVYLLIQALPFLLIMGIAFFALRQVQKGGNSGAMGFGRSKA